ncbi:MAG TPA: DUF5317 domain-containing protein [Candidatus Limnocylindrales bacterium]|nr:DUF5317 domain-containing protein [Candidatus Limnocylindrales bacterium]
MFLLYAIVVGVVLGFVLGGRLSGLATLDFKWAPLALLGLAIQIVLFSGPVSDRVGDLGPVIYVGSTALVLLVVIRNIRIAGMPLVAIGAASNLLAIVANGGYMPTTQEAAGAAGRVEATTYSNSAIVDGAVLVPLTDIFALPAWLPLHNVFSIGDVLIGVGVAMAIVVAMRRGASSAGGASRNLPQPRTPA